MLPGVDTDKHNKLLADAARIQHMKNFFSISGGVPRKGLKDYLIKACYFSTFAADRFRPFVRKKKYRGFITYYSRGTSLINGIRGNKVYEEELSKTIISYISKNCCKFFLDIGANIGLITLNVLSEIPEIHVFAFEPGPHQSVLFEKTIKKNRLENKVSLYKVALGSVPGMTPFMVHCTQDASGDGFLDTGRAGKTQSITIMVKTIDEWWKSENSPNVGVVKIDTEGSEFLILKGAVEFLRVCRPLVFLEIWPPNLRSYGISPIEILFWLNRSNYGLETLDGKAVTSDNLCQVYGTVDMFVARPISR